MLHTSVAICKVATLLDWNSADTFWFLLIKSRPLPQLLMNATNQQERDSEQYLERKAFYDRVLTVYGRQTCQEILSDNTIRIHKLHLSESNKPVKIISDIVELAGKRDVDTVYHTKQALSRISKNARQDQGVALDILPERFRSYKELEDYESKNTIIGNKNRDVNTQASAGQDSVQNVRTLIALDRINNPNNLGLLIRSVTAAPNAAILYDRKGSAPLDAMALKASAGTLYKAPLYQGPLTEQLVYCKKLGIPIVGLDGHSNMSVHQFRDELTRFDTKTVVYVLGNESSGLRAEVRKLLDLSIAIPMANGVESLNVAVTGSLLAFNSFL